MNSYTKYKLQPIVAIDRALPPHNLYWCIFIMVIGQKVCNLYIL